MECLRLLNHINKPNTMETKNILSNDVLDLLFDGRNKAYGAYALRKQYNKRIRIALLVTTLLVAVFVAAALFANNGKGNRQVLVGPDVELQKIEDPKQPEEKLPPPPPKEVPKPEVVAYNVPKIVKDELVEEMDEVKTVDELDQVKLGAFNQEGEKGDPDMVAPPVEKVAAIGGPLREEKETETVYTVVQNPAEFPGGLAGWTKYLQKNLNSDLPVQNGAPAGKYTVVVSFIVSKDGSISDVAAENDPGYGTKNEAIRVIQKGPVWKPAVQNGRNVIYRQRQSIVFMVNEDLPL